MMGDGEPAAGSTVFLSHSTEDIPAALTASCPCTPAVSSTAAGTGWGARTSSGWTPTAASWTMWGPRSRALGELPVRGARKTTVALRARLATACLLLATLAPLARGQSLRDLETWLTQQEFFSLNPARPDLSPGSLVRMQGAALVDVGRVSPTSPSTHDVTAPAILLDLKVQQSFFNRFFFGPSEQARFLEDVSEVRLALNRLRRTTVGLIDLQDRITASPDLVRKISEAKTRVYVVSEVLLVDAMHLVAHDRAGVEITDRRRLKNVAQALGDDGKQVGGDGIVFERPTAIGCRLVEVRHDGKVLGSERGKIVLEVHDPIALEHEMRLTATPPADLYSRYQICALAIGLGNYGDGELASLGGGPDSARLFEQTIARSMPPHRRHLLRVVTSRTAGNAFARDKPLTKSDLEQAVMCFVDEMKATLDPSRETLVVFYAFGHGVVSGFSHWPFLAPEDFEPRGREEDFEDELIPLAWVVEELEQLADRVVVLVDACREHDFEDRAFAGWLRHRALDQQGLAQLSEDMHEILAFSGGLYGPQPMLFGDRNGSAAKPVAAADLSPRDVGPVAVRLARLAGEMKERRYLDLHDLVAGLETPLDRPGAEWGVRAYTALRDDFRDDLPATVVWTTDVTSTVARPEPWTYPPRVSDPDDSLDADDDEPWDDLEDLLDESDEASSFEVEPELIRSGVGVYREAPGPFVGLDDFFYALRMGVGYLTDKDGFLWRHDRHESSVESVGAMGATALGVTPDGELFIHDASLLGIEHLEHDVGFRQVVADVTVLGFDECASDDAVLVRVREDRGFVLCRLRPGSIDSEWSLNEPHVLDLVESEPGRFAASLRNATLLWIEGDGATTTALPDGRADCLTAFGGTVYGLTPGGRHLYRLRPGQALEALSLLRPEDDESYRRPPGIGGFQAVSEHELLLLAGDAVWRLDLTDAKWAATR